MGERHQADTPAERRGGFVELFGQCFDQLEAVIGAADQQGVAPLIRQHNDLQIIGCAAVQGGALRHACVHQLLQGGSDDVRVGIVEGEYANVAQVERELLIQLLEQGFN